MLVCLSTSLALSDQTVALGSEEGGADAVDCLGLWAGGKGETCLWHLRKKNCPIELSGPWAGRGRPA